MQHVGAQMHQLKDSDRPKVHKATIYLYYVNVSHIIQAEELGLQRPCGP